MQTILTSLVAFLLLAGTALAQDEAEIDLELVLAVDISFSMDPSEQVLQRDGYVAAFRHPDVIAAISNGAYGRIAVSYVEWAGTTTNRITVPWMIIEDRQSAERFASAIEQSLLKRAFRTSISNALMFSALQFASNDVTGLRRVIDVSGDGTNNQGAAVDIIRDVVTAQGITINGLPILIKRPGSANGYFDIDALDDYYRDCVIGGSGAFLIPVRSTQEFAEAIRRKLVLEIAGGELSPQHIVPAGFQSIQNTGRMDCQIGEKIWQRWMDREGAF